MLLERIKKFIEEVHSADTQHLDKARVDLVVQRFGSRQEGTRLSEDDLSFLERQFTYRWAQIKASKMPTDYTLNPKGVNEPWVALAKDLAPCTDKTYIQILFPEVPSLIDPISFEPLQETIHPNNLFLGDDGRTLYRKRGLCEHLMKRGLILSMKRPPNGSILPITVGELARLQACAVFPESSFQIGSEKFSCFWDWLNRKVVPNLNTSGAFPEDHTPHLLLLINQYFVLQEIRADFHLFQEELRLFTDRLYTSPIELVNQLYGAQFAVGSQRYYLFQLLIVLHGATTYCLDDQLRDVLKWLYLSDPRWWIEHHSLNEVYAEVDRTRPLRLPVQKSLGTCEYQECMCMLLSLYTYKFETSSLFRQEISILDKVNLIPCKLAAIEAEFAPVLKSKEGIGLLDVYTNQKKNTIIPCAEHSGQSSSWASYLDSNVNAKIWCTKVLNREWLDLGVTWYDPKLLIHALVRFRPRSKGNTDAINLFIDGLIQTYTQSASKLQKQLRVNILFGDLLTSLGTNSSEHKLLLMWVSIFSRHDYKGNFLSNCIYHVGNRLHEISVVSLATSSGFFAAVTALDPHIKFNISSLHIESVRESIDEFKREIQSIESQINPELRNKLISYLQKLGEVIITVEQRVAAEQSGRFGDPFAAPS